VDFEQCRLYKRAMFDDVRFIAPVNFSGATFKGVVGFNDVRFRSSSLFNGARFKAGVHFNGSSFEDDASFSFARFASDAVFLGVRFHRGCDFVECRFRHGLYFIPRRIPNDGTMSNPMFLGDADFTRSSFGGRTLFRDATFSRRVSFCSIRSEVAFALEGTAFSGAPDFTEATFHEPPRLDDCVIVQAKTPYGIFADDPAKDPRPPSILFDMYRSDFNVARDKDEHARLRKLRKMAADAKDHENELKFNGYEIAARRFWVDKPNGLRFWLGWLYGLTSNYGQSILRPLLLWLSSIVFFWGIIHVTTLDHAMFEPSKCHGQFREATGENEPPYRGLGATGQSFSLAFRNALVIERPDPAIARRMYGCLYGLERATPSRAEPDADAKSGAGSWPVIPLSVTLISAVQSLLSVVLLFLLGLGLRNTFRMK
jgi:uncharacterized protein YjbI with pentapeptide repeats